MMADCVEPKVSAFVFKCLCRIDPFYDFICKTPSEAPWTEGIKTGEIVTSKSVVNAFKSLLLFHQWMTQYSFMFPSHDHAMLFTG